MENLPPLFKPKQENIAKFYAYMTNSFIDRDEKGQLFLLRQTEINEIIAQMYEKKDFIHAARLFESLKELPKGQDNEIVAVISKSLRLDPITYLETQKVAHREKICLSDVIRTTSIPKMRKKLDEIKNVPTVDQEKLGIMYDNLKVWEDKKSTSPDKESLPRFNFTVTNEIKKSVSEFKKYSLNDDLICEGFPKEVIEDIKEHLDFDTSLEEEEAFPEVSISFNSQSNFEIDVIWIGDNVIFERYNEFKKNIDDNLQKKLDDLYKYKYTGDNNYYYDDEWDALWSNFYELNISGNLQIENEKLFFDDVDIEQRDALNALIYEKITKEKYTDFAVEECMKRVQDALLKNEYDEAAQLNEKLARFQVTSKISSWYGDIIASMASESNVVTFTIPKLLLMLWEAAKGDKSAQKFVKDNLQEV